MQPRILRHSLNRDLRRTSQKVAPFSHSAPPLREGEENSAKVRHSHPALWCRTGTAQGGVCGAEPRNGAHRSRGPPSIKSK
jgi:hypothetical protein